MRHSRLVLAALVVGGAAAAALLGRWPWKRLEVTAPPIQVASEPVETRRDTLQQGESLGSLLARHGVEPIDLASVVELLGVDARRLRAGMVFSFQYRQDEDQPREMMVRTGPELRVRLVRSDDAWTAERRPIAWTTDTLRIGGTIESSLYEALDQSPDAEALGAEARVRLAWDLADVYAWSVDFSRDLQEQDRFTAVVERQISEEGEQRLGRILGAELELGGKRLSAFRFAIDGQESFFDDTGNSLRRAFLRAPVEFRRISSGFTKSRFHPILGIWRAHQGTDYSAASGTPVMAAGEGVVLQAGWVGGYGRLIELRHRNGITTRYGHLSGFAAGIRTGTRVRQGQVIGYVGATGLATAPHLHYEFRVNGVPRDSRTADLGTGEPIPAALAAAFQQQRANLADLMHQPPSRPAVVAGAD